MKIDINKYFHPGIILAFFYIMMFIAGCGVEKTDESRVQDVDYCIVEENDIPEELMAKIEEKKAADLKMVFENDDFVYIPSYPYVVLKIQNMDKNVIFE